MEKLYVQYRKEFVGWSMKKYGIPKDEALDHYQDTMTIFFEKVISGSLEEVQSSIKTYVFGIGKNRMPAPGAHRVVSMQPIMRPRQRIARTCAE